MAEQIFVAIWRDHEESGTSRVFGQIAEVSALLLSRSVDCGEVAYEGAGTALLLP